LNVNAPKLAADVNSEVTVIYEGKPSWKSEFGSTMFGVLLIPVLAGVFMLVAAWVRRANTTYRITNRRIEWETGLFSRRIDGVDLWRIRHVNYVQTLADRLFGLSRLEMFSQDREDPHAVIPGIPGAREVYDRATLAIQNARQGTVGVLQ
jgi:membrane protein YdbS with pleckstrin-like domain